MHLNKDQRIFELVPYYMATDNLILLNQQITLLDTQTTQYVKKDFADYLGIYKILLKNKNDTPSQHIHIYDITYNPQYPNGAEFFINDHIHRIGDNPFIGKQPFFNIDFINVENIYIQNKKGIITTCYGKRYEANKTEAVFPSTHIANIVALAHINKYSITGSLINQL